jgi:hypothetical protein
MNRKIMLAAAVFAAAMNLGNAALAGANDYAFEAVKAEVKKGSGVVVTVRLVHRPTGKPVSNAVIFSPRIDMSPEGMATMAAPLTPVAGGELGTYSFKTDLVMAGGWLLSLSAKVQGEPETVQGKITFKATN